MFGGDSRQRAEQILDRPSPTSNPILLFSAGCEHLDEPINARLPASAADPVYVPASDERGLFEESESLWADMSHDRLERAALLQGNQRTSSYISVASALDAPLHPEEPECAAPTAAQRSLAYTSSFSSADILELIPTTCEQTSTRTASPSPVQDATTHDAQQAPPEEEEPHCELGLQIATWSATSIAAGQRLADLLAPIPAQMGSSAPEPTASVTAAATAYQEQPVAGAVRGPGCDALEAPPAAVDAVVVFGGAALVGSHDAPHAAVQAEMCPAPERLVERIARVESEESEGEVWESSSDEGRAAAGGTPQVGFAEEEVRVGVAREDSTSSFTSSSLLTYSTSQTIPAQGLDLGWGPSDSCCAGYRAASSARLVAMEGGEATPPGGGAAQGPSMETPLEALAAAGDANPEMNKPTLGSGVMDAAAGRGHPPSWLSPPAGVLPSVGAVHPPARRILSKLSIQVPPFQPFPSARPGTPSYLRPTVSSESYKAATTSPATPTAASLRPASGPSVAPPNLSPRLLETPGRYKVASLQEALDEKKLEAELKLRDTLPRPPPKNTVVQQFRLSTAQRAEWDNSRAREEERLTTEERAAKQAEEERAALMARMKRSRESLGRCTPPRPPPAISLAHSLTIPRPFQLASEARHQQCRQELQLKVEVQEQEQEKMRVFRATSFDEKVKAGAEAHKTPKGCWTIKAQAPTFTTDARVEARRNKEAGWWERAQEVVRAREERERALREREEREGEEYCRTHQFRATPVPASSRAATPRPRQRLPLWTPRHLALELSGQ